MLFEGDPDVTPLRDRRGAFPKDRAGGKEGVEAASTS